MSKEILMTDLKDENVIKFKEERKKKRDQYKQDIEKIIKKASWDAEDFKRNLQDFWEKIYSNAKTKIIKRQYLSPKHTSLSLEHQKEALEVETKNITEEAKKFAKELEEQVKSVKELKAAGLSAPQYREAMKVLEQMGGGENFKKYLQTLIKKNNNEKNAEKPAADQETYPLTDQKRRYLKPFKNIMKQQANSLPKVLKKEDTQETLLKLIAANEKSFRAAGIKTANDFKKQVIPAFAEAKPTDVSDEHKMRKYLDGKFGFSGGHRLLPVPGEGKLEL